MMPEMGGMLRYGIPQYRLPKEVLDKELKLVEKLGIELKNNIKIGRDITLDELKNKYDAVIAAPGAWSSTKMRVDGEDAQGVFGGIDFLRSVILGSPADIGKVSRSAAEATPQWTPAARQSVSARKRFISSTAALVRRCPPMRSKSTRRRRKA